MSLPSATAVRLVLTLVCAITCAPSGMAGARLTLKAASSSAPATTRVVDATSGLDEARVAVARAREALAATPSEANKGACIEAIDRFVSAAGFRLDELEAQLAGISARLKASGNVPSRGSTIPDAIAYRRVERELVALLDEVERVAPGRSAPPHVTGTGDDSSDRATCAEGFDAEGTSDLPLGWTSSTMQGRFGQPVWTATASGADAGSGCASARAMDRVTDSVLDSLEMPVQSRSATVSFRTSFNLERGFDGMVLEVRAGNGEFQDIVEAGGAFVSGGYTGRISRQFGSPLAGREAWTGNSAGYVTETVLLPASAAGRVVVLRWRLATDSGVPGDGVRIDSISTTGIGCSAPKGRAGLRPDAPAVPVTFSFTGPPAAIPDGLGAEVPGAPVLVNLPVSGLSGTISDVNFRFDGSSCSNIAGSTTVGLDHTFVGDLVVTLQSPSGTMVTVINRLSNGGGSNSGNNFCQTLLDDSGSVTIQSQLSAAAPLTGTFIPANALSAFNGENPNGTWQLRVTDFFVGDLGSIRAFSLVIDSGVVPCTLTCPGNIVTNEDAPGSGSAIVNYPDPTENGACQFVFCDPASGSSFPLGTTTVTCSESFGRGQPPLASCTFDITVNPIAACVLTCPANVAVSNDPNQCGAVVNYPPPTATNCGAVTCVPPAGSFFPVGTTTVNCSENVIGRPNGGATCSFTVTVNDAQPPAITCPANVVTSAGAGACTAVVNYAATTASDNCPGVTVACVPASGSTFALGTTTVTCTATDAAANTATCAFTVTVNDTVPPTITCPANITSAGTIVSGCALSAVVTYPTPVATDNCGVGSVVCAPASGSTFPEGTTTVTCTATDTAGNTATCTFSVTVSGAAVFGTCVVDDLTGDTFSIVTDPTSSLYRYWRYRVAATGEVICGTANLFSFIPGRSLIASDNDDPRFFMDANVNFSANTATVTVEDRAPRRRFVLRDRNLRNDPPCQ